MKKLELRQIIKEEIDNILSEAHIDKVVKDEKRFNRYKRFDGKNAYHNYYYTIDNLLRRKRENPALFKHVMKQFKYGDSDKDLEQYVAKSGSRQNMWHNEWDKVLRNIQSGHYSIDEEILKEIASAEVGNAYKLGDVIEVIVGVLRGTKYSTIEYSIKWNGLKSVGSSPESSINFWGKGKPIKLTSKLKSDILKAVKSSWNEPEHGNFKHQEDIYKDAISELR